MKKIISLTFIVCSVLILASCEDKDEVADEIVDYYNNEWAPHNNMVHDQRDIVVEMVSLEKEGKFNKIAELISGEIIPTVDEALDQFKSIDPANKRIKKMNDMQIDVDNHFKKMLKDIVTYYEGGDVSEQDIKGPREELNEKQEDVLEYRDKLMDKYDLEEVEYGEEGDDDPKRFPNIRRAEDE